MDGSANLMNLLLSVHAAGLQPFERGHGLLDGPHWLGSYACADGRYVSVCALEWQFNALLFRKLGLAEDPEFRQPYDPACWARLRERLAALFASQPRQHWVDLLEGSDGDPSRPRRPRPKRCSIRRHMAARAVYANRVPDCRRRPRRDFP